MFEQQLARLSSMPPRTLESLPGLAIFSVVPKSMVFLPLLFLLVFLVVPLSIIRSDPQSRLQWGRTDDAQGTIVSATDTSCRGTAARRLVYAFTAAGRGEFRGTALVCPGTLYYAAQSGDAIQLRYLADDPAVNALRGTPDNSPPLALFLAMPPIVLALLTGVYAPQVRETLRARRLIARGQLTDGSILFIKRRNNLSRPSWQSGGLYDVHVEYAADGSRREAVGWCGNEWLVNQWTAGSKVHIAYLEQIPGKIAVLEAFIK
jgi:hypothetical protein